MDQVKDSRPMNKKKVQAVLKKMSYAIDDLGDFTISLSHVHDAFSNALGIAQAFIESKVEMEVGDDYGAGDEQFDDGWGGSDDGSLDEYGGSEGFGGFDPLKSKKSDLEEKYLSDLMSSINAAFNGGGIVSAANTLGRFIRGAVDIEPALSSKDQIDTFLVQYGLTSFLDEKFDESLFSIDDQEDVPQAVVEEPVEEDDDIQSFESTITSEEVRARVGQIFSSEELAQARDISSDPASKLNSKPWRTPNTTFIALEQGIFQNIDTSHRAFEQDGSDNNYSRRLKEAQKLSDEVTGLNFHPVFAALGANADGLRFNTEADEPYVAVSLNKMAAIRRAAKDELQRIKKDITQVQADFVSAAKRSGTDMRDERAKYYTGRARCSNALDDLLASVKRRDEYISKQLYTTHRASGYKVMPALTKRGYELSAEFRDRTSSLHKLLIEICEYIIFVDISQEVFRLKASDKGLSKKFKDHYDTLSPKFKEEYALSLGTKVRQFFSPGQFGAWARDSFCSWAARGVSRTTLVRNTVNKHFNLKTKQYLYSSCSVCGKDIYIRSATESAPGSGRKGEIVSREEYSEYSVPTYSFFDRKGNIISEAMLRDSGPYAAPDSHPEYSEPKEWPDIVAMVSSGDRATHKEGVIRRSEALRVMGAKLISPGSIQVSTNKYKCPYSEIDEGVESAIRTSGYSSAPKVSDFECGLYIDPTPVIQGEVESLAALPTVKPPSGTSSLNLFEAKLSAAVEGGLIDLERKTDILNQFKVRAAGGWKFSNKFFKCPTKIDIPSGWGNAELSRSKYLSKFSYLAAPLSGPVSHDRTSYDELTGKPGVRSAYYPPADGSGGYAQVEEGTMTYLVCGEKTSLSSFSRDKNMEGSLYDIVLNMSEKIKENPESRKLVYALAEQLLSLGVDVADVMPFFENMGIDRMGDLEDKAIPGLEVISKQDDDRLNKIAVILSTAMANPVKLDKAVSGLDNTNLLELIGDLKLVCSHGHAFSVRDSVYFGLGHTGVNFRNKSASAYSANDIIKSGVLLSEGESNFSATLKHLRDKSGRRFIQSGDEISLIGDDRTRKYEYGEWRSLKRTSAPLNRLMFKGEDGSYYGFESSPRSHIWGSAQGNRLSSAKEREMVDPATKTYLSEDILVANNGSITEDGGDSSAKNQEKADLAAWQDEVNRERAAQRIDSGLIDVAINEVPGRLSATIRSFLLSMQSFLKLSTALEVSSSLQGGSDTISFSEIPTWDDQWATSANEVERTLWTGAKACLDMIVDIFEDDDTPTFGPEGIRGGAYDIFKEKYLSQFDNVEISVIEDSESIVREFLSVGILRSVIDSVSANVSDKNVRNAKIREILSRFSVRGSVNYETFFSHSGGEGRTVGQIIDEIMDKLKKSNLSDEKKREILTTDPLAIKGKRSKGGGYESSGSKDWYEEGLPSEYGVTDQISQMKGKNYMARVLKASSALYLADMLSNAYNLFMLSERFDNYIGYDIGVDLSTPEKVLAVTDEDINTIWLSASRLADSFGSNYEKNALAFFNDKIIVIDACREYLERSMFSMKTACLSSKYMSKATTYITAALREMVREVADPSDPGSIKANLIIDNVMTNEPFTTMSLNSDGKYRRYFGGDGAINPEGLMPTFPAKLMRLNSDGKQRFYPIYKLSDISGFHHSFEISPWNHKPTSAGTCYVLSKVSLPGKAALMESETADLPDVYRQQGWSVYEVLMGRGDDMYSDFGKDMKNEGWKAGVSTALHPGTVAVSNSEGIVSSYVNDELGIDTASAISVGPLSVRTGGSVTLPPNPYADSNVGVPIPVDWKGDVTSGDIVFPVVGTKIPVEIDSPESEGVVTVDISDFLMRDPPEEAIELLDQIDSMYSRYQDEVARGRAAGLSEQALSQIEDTYKRVIRSLHSAYKGLPLRVTGANISTYKSTLQTRAFAPKSSLYMPMVDWVTMNRMLTSEVFGPKWGGHGAWSAEESGDAVRQMRLDALQSFLIKTNNLDTLAALIGRSIDRRKDLRMGTTEVDPRELLEPLERLIKKHRLEKVDVDNIFGGNVSSAILKVGPYGVGWRDEAAGNAQKDVLKKFSTWAKGPGKFYSTGIESGEDIQTDEPSAYIRVMNSIFPSNKVSKKLGDSPRALLNQARDPDHPDILTEDLFFAYKHTAGIGGGRGLSYWPIPDNEAELKKYLDKINRIKHISAAKHAEGISNYLAHVVKTEVTRPLQIKPKKGAVSSYGLVKISKKLNANLYFGGTINDERLLSLWNLMNE